MLEQCDSRFTIEGEMGDDYSNLEMFLKDSNISLTKSIVHSFLLVSIISLY